MKVAIWCEVTCGKCGALAASSRFYKNAATIREIKEATKDWAFDKEYGNLCPNCREMKRFTDE